MFVSALPTVLAETYNQSTKINWLLYSFKLANPQLLSDDNWKSNYLLSDDKDYN
jgi:hypothetical protein